MSASGRDGALPSKIDAPPPSSTQVLVSPSIHPVPHTASWLLSFRLQTLKPRLLGPRAARESSRPQLPHVKNAGGA